MDASTEEAAAQRHEQLVAAMRRSVVDGEGFTDPALRRAAASGGELPELLAAYVHKVRDESYRITDADIAALRGSGYGEEEIFEITIATAVGAASRRLEAGLRALQAGR